MAIFIRRDLPAAGGEGVAGFDCAAERRLALELGRFIAFHNQPPETCGNIGMLTFHRTRTDHESA